MMSLKKIVLTLVVAMGAIFSGVSQEKMNAVKCNVIGLVAGQYQFAYERALNEKFSAQLSAGYIGDNILTSGTTDSTDLYRTGFIVIPEVRYYFGEALNGAYVAGFFRFRQTDNGLKDLINDQYDNTYRVRRTIYGGGLTFGYQAILSEMMVFDIFLGPQFKGGKYDLGFKYPEKADPSYELDDSQFKIEKNGVGLRFGFNLGIAF